MKRKMICLLMTLLLLLSFPVTAMADDDNGAAEQTVLPSDHDSRKAIRDFEGSSVDMGDLNFTTASDVTEGDWTYRIDDNDTVGDTSDDIAMLTGYTGTSSTVTTPTTTLGGIPVVIIAGAFYYNATIVTVTISEGVELLYDFVNCSALTTVNLPSTLKVIVDGSFVVCKALQSITLPSGLEVIGSNCFFNIGLTSITIPASVTSIGYWTFDECPGMQTINVDPANSSYKSSDGVLFNKSGTTLVMYPKGRSHTSYTVPEGVQIIGPDAFYIAHLTQVTLPQSLIAIGDFAFYENDLVNVNIPPSVQYIGQMVFAYNGYLEKFIVSNNNTTYDCDNTGYGVPGALFFSSPNVVMYGNAGSTTQSYANTYGIPFSVPVPVGISCTKTDATVYGSATGSVTISASGGNTGVYDYSINGGSWQSSNVFSGLSAGDYTAAVRDALFTNNTATCGVNVGQPAYMGNVPAKKISSKVNAGNALTIVPPAPPKGYTLQSVTYSSSNPAIATVDASGNVIFLAGGKVSITTKIVSQMVDKKGKVKTKTTTVKKTITVKQPVSSISLNLSDATIARTQKVKLTTAIAPGTASSKKVKWTSSNKKVATVSSSGVVVGKAGGTAVITCTATDGSGATASCTVNVTPIYPTAIKLSKAALTLKTGKSSSLKATITPKNTDFKTVTWASSNPGAVTVDAKGKLKAVAPGTAVITATTSSGQTASCTVTVN